MDPQEILLEYEKARENRTTWMSEANVDHEFKNSIQYTESEIKQLKERGQAPVVVNRILPQVSHQVNMIVSYMPGPTVVPASGGDEDKADLHRRILNHILYRSNYPRVVKQVVTDQVTDGVGWFYAFVDRNPIDGRPEIFVGYIPWYRVFPDPESIRPDISDAAYVYVANYISRARAKVLFPEYADRIDEIASSIEDVPTASGYSEENIKLWKIVTDGQKDNVLYLERYYQEREKHYVLTSLVPEKPLTVIMDSRQFSEFREQYGSAIDNEVMVTEANLPVIKREAILGYDSVAKDTLYTWFDNYPIYPVVPAWYEHLGNTEPIGLVRSIRGQQQLFNKLNMIIVAHGIATAGVRLMGPENAVDKDEIQVELSKPIGYISIKPLPDKLLKPEPLNVNPLPPAVFALLEDIKRDFEYTAGSSSMSLGVPEKVPRTGIATLAMEEWARRRIAPVMQNTADAVERLGRVLIRLVQKYYSDFQVIRIVNPQEPEKMEEIAVNLPLYDSVSQRAIETINDVTVGIYDVRVDVNKYTFSSRMAELQFYAQLYHDGLLDDIALMQMLPIPNKDELIKRKSLLAQLQAAIKEMAEYAKMLEDKNKIQENQLIMTQLRNKILEITSRLERQEAEKRLRAEREFSLVMDNLKTAAEEAKRGGKGGE